MKSKNLIMLIVAAVILGAVAYFVGNANGSKSPKLNGRAILPSLDISSIATINVNEKLRLAAKDDGWVVETYHNYPADRAKLAENLMKLTELKVGQTARGKKLGQTTPLKLLGAHNEIIAELKLGEKHPKYGHGRYLDFNGTTVLASDSLDAFEVGADKNWIETKIVDEPWISFNDIADNSLTEADFGFKTGVVAKVTVGSDTNRTMTIGNVVKGGSDRYLKINGLKWVFKVSSYFVDKFLPKPPKVEPKPKGEVKKADVKKADVKKADVKKADVKKADK